MESYCVFVCETCGKESRYEDDISHCKAHHLGLTVGGNRALLRRFCKAGRKKGMTRCKECKFWYDREAEDEYPAGYIITEYIGRCNAPADVEGASWSDTCEMFLFDFDGVSAGLYTTHDFCCKKFKPKE